jgi:hypothetical protein
MTWFIHKPTRVQAARIKSIDGEHATFDVGDDSAGWLYEALAKDVGELGGVWSLNGGLRIGTLEGTMRADPGDYVVRGTEGEIYAVKGTIFENVYEQL